jgi:hypothetical protein
MKNAVISKRLKRRDLIGEISPKALKSNAKQIVCPRYRWRTRIVGGVCLSALAWSCSVPRQQVKWCLRRSMRCNSHAGRSWQCCLVKSPLPVLAIACGAQSCFLRGFNQVWQGLFSTSRKYKIAKTAFEPVFLHFFFPLTGKFLAPSTRIERATYPLGGGRCKFKMSYLAFDFICK